jgi:hypothetical protein
MSDNGRILILLIGWFVACSLISAVGVFLLRYLFFERSFHESLQYCIKYKLVIGLFSLGYVLLSGIDMKVTIPYFSYIFPFIFVIGTILIAKGVIPSFG